jgi:alkylation response protein AidB-like acyl-CoA dehydrogenase
MDFQPSDERRMLADTLARWLRERYAFETRQAIAASPEGLSRAAWRALAELGTLAACFTEPQGGLGQAGQTGFDIATVFETLGAGLPVEPWAGALMAGQALAAAGGQDDALAALIAGERLTLLAHEEDDTGAGAEWVAARAVREGDGWRLGGRKVAVAGAMQADGFVVSVRSAGVPGEADGLSLLYLPADTPGLQRQPHGLFDGGRGAALVLDGLRVDDRAFLGAPGQAHATLERALGAGLLALSAEALGAMEVAKAATLDYLRTRRQFGVPIGSFQALQHRMADLLLEIEQARSAVIHAAAAFDAPQRPRRERALSAAKHTVGRVGVRVAEEAIQLHGGIGMTWELPLAHVAKRLVMIDHQLGDEDAHLARYIRLAPATENVVP